MDGDARARARRPEDRQRRFCPRWSRSRPTARSTSATRLSRSSRASRSRTTASSMRPDFPAATCGAVIRSVKRYMGLGGDEIAPRISARYTFADLTGSGRALPGRQTHLHAVANFRGDFARAQESRRSGDAGRKSRARRHYRAGLLQRRPAPGDQGCGTSRRPRSGAAGERAHRGLARVWTAKARRRQRRGL